MSLGRFYWEWWRRAAHYKLGWAKAWHGWVALVSAFAAACVNVWWPGMTWAQTVATWLPFGVFASVFLSSLGRGLIVAPYEIYADETIKVATANAKLATSESAAQSTLQFVPAGEMTIGEMPTLPNAKICRVALKNFSDTTPSENVEVMLVAATDLSNGERQPHRRLLQEGSGAKVVTINPGVTKYFNAALVRPDKNPPSGRYAPWDGTSPRRFGVGTFRLEIEAAGGSGSPKVTHYALALAQNGGVTFEPAALD